MEDFENSLLDLNSSGEEVSDEGYPSPDGGYPSPDGQYENKNLLSFTTSASFQDDEEIRTLFVSGLPLDTTSRELHLLFHNFDGYEMSMLKRGETIDKTTLPVGFVKFTKREKAEAAMAKLIGFQFDPYYNNVLRIDFAKHNTRKAQKASTKETTTTTATTQLTQPNIYNAVNNAYQPTYLNFAYACTDLGSQMINYNAYQTLVPYPIKFQTTSIITGNANQPRPHQPLIYPTPIHLQQYAGIAMAGINPYHVESAYVDKPEATAASFAVPYQCAGYNNDDVVNNRNYIGNVVNPDNAYAKSRASDYNAIVANRHAVDYNHNAIVDYGNSGNNNINNNSGYNSGYNNNNAITPRALTYESAYPATRATSSGETSTPNFSYSMVEDLLASAETSRPFAPLSAYPASGQPVWKTGDAVPIDSREFEGANFRYVAVDPNAYVAASPRVYAPANPDRYEATTAGGYNTANPFDSGYDRPASGYILETPKSARFATRSASAPQMSAFASSATSVFVSNLAADSSEEGLRLKYAHYPGLKNVRLLNKGKSPVAFLDFYDENFAKEAVKLLKDPHAKLAKDSEAGLRIELSTCNN